MTYKIILISSSVLLIISLILPSFVFAQDIEAPGSLDEARDLGEKFGESAQKELPVLLEKIWKQQVLPVWQKIWQKIVDKMGDWWSFSAWPKIEQELEKEKQELEQEIEKEMPKIKEDLWQRFKELLDKNF